MLELDMHRWLWLASLPVKAFHLKLKFYHVRNMDYENGETKNHCCDNGRVVVVRRLGLRPRELECSRHEHGRNHPHDEELHHPKTEFVASLNGVGEIVPPPFHGFLPAVENDELTGYSNRDSG